MKKENKIDTYNLLAERVSYLIIAALRIEALFMRSANIAVGLAIVPFFAKIPGGYGESQLASGCAIGENRMQRSFTEKCSNPQ
jgi:hypothetical protein